MSQILAIARVRVQLLINSLRQRTSGWARLAGGLTLFLGLLLSLGIAALVTAVTLSEAEPGDAESVSPGLLACFWASAFFGLVMPLLLSSGASGLDTARLITFPIRRRRLFVVTWASSFLSTDHLVYVPVLIGTYGAVVVTGHAGGLGGALVFLLLPLIVVTWSLGLLTLLQSVMRHRRGKEIAGMIGFAIFITLSIVPSVMAQRLDDEHEEPVVVFENGAEVELEIEDMDPFTRIGEQYGPLLAVAPPLLATRAVTAFAGADGRGGFMRLLALVAWWLAGLGFSYLAFGWRLREPAGRAANSSASASRTSVWDATAVFTFLPVEVVAMASKELRYIFRSSVGKLNIFLIPVVCAFLLTALGQLEAPGLSNALGGQSDHAMLFGLMLYGLLFTNNFANNSVGWEGNGFKTYLLAPISFRRVLFGKNLGIWIYSAILYALVLITWSFLRSVPSIGLLFSTASFFSGAILIFTASGNFASLAFPVVRDISAMKSQPSQPAILMSLLTVLCLIAALLFLAALSMLLPGDLASVAVMGTFNAGAILLYWLSLPRAAALFKNNRDKILAKLESGS